MTLTEAIKHCEDVADYDCFTDDQRKCSEEHRQLADWLRELKERREKAQLSGEDATFDCISRQDAINAINACCVKYDISPNYDDKRTDKEKFYDWWDMHKVLSMRIINDLPSASTEFSTFSDKLWKIAYERGKEEGRKKGKWLRCGNHHLCSECDEWALTRWDEDECDEVDILTDFCPNCGADMREGD